MTIEQDFEMLAKELGLSVRILKRLLGDSSLKIKREREDDLPAVLHVHVGLRLLGRLESLPSLSSSLTDKLKEAIAGFKKSCPHSYRWLVNGAFDPTKIPDDVTVARLQHASRTCGRLRADILRHCG